MHLPPPAPGALCLIESDIGAVDQFVGRHRWLGHHGDPDAGRNVGGLVGYHHRRVLEGRKDASSGRRPFLNGAQFREQYGEFVAPEARHQIFTTNDPTQRLGHLTQHVVAGGVAEGVIDLLEAVEVEKQHARHTGVALEAGDRTLHRLAKGQPVGQTREDIRAGLMDQLRLSHLDRRHVRGETLDAQHHGGRRRAAASLRDRRQSKVLPRDLPVSTQHPQHDRGIASTWLVHNFVEEVAVVGMHESIQQAPIGDDLRRFVAQRRHDAPADVARPAGEQMAKHDIARHRTEPIQQIATERDSLAHGSEAGDAR